MRIPPLYLTIIVIMSCEPNSNRFDIKSSEFQKKSSHHYSELFVDSSKILLKTNSEEDGESQIAGSIANNQIFEIQDELHNESFINSLINWFSDSEPKLDSLALDYNECEERLYSSEDERNTQRLAMNSLINERNQLLRQLDSLQTNLTISRRTSNDQIKQIVVDNNKLQSLIDLLAREIE